MFPKIRVAILEDQQIAIDCYSFRLQGAPEFDIVGVANVYSDWEPLLATHPPDVALMDVKVPAAPDKPEPYPILHVMASLVQTHPEMAFLVISAYPEPTLIQGVMEAGANGYILKDDNALLRNLKSILAFVAANGGIYLSPQAQQLLLQRQAAGAELGLTPRQVEALALCATYPESSMKELTGRMNVAASTFRNLLSQAYLRLEVTGSVSSPVTRASHRPGAARLRSPASPP